MTNVKSFGQYHKNEDIRHEINLLTILLIAFLILILTLF